MAIHRHGQNGVARLDLLSRCGFLARGTCCQDKIEPLTLELGVCTFSVGPGFCSSCRSNRFRLFFAHHWCQHVAVTDTAGSNL